MVRYVKSLRPWALLTILFLFVISCENEEPSVKKGTLSFSFDANSASSNGRKAAQDDVKSLLVTIENTSGVKVYDRKQITLYSFGAEFISEPIELPSGDYRLTEFFVLNADNEVTYATPLEGSKLAHLVDDPLPIEFTIIRDQTAKVTPQVVAIDEFSNAEDFGYTTFSFDIVKTISFQVAVFVYDTLTANFELTTSHLSITADDQSLFNQDLPDSTSKIVVKDGYSPYQLTITKPGYKPYAASFTAEALAEYHSGAVLKIILLEPDNSIDEGLIAYYPFNGNPSDQSGNNLNGINHGANLTTDRKGIPNAAFQFDGNDDYIQVPHHDLLNLSGDFTISLWAEIDSNQVAHEGINDILRKWNGTHEGYPFAIAYLNQTASDDIEDKLIFVRYDGQACGHGPTSYSPPVTNGVFQHIVLVKTGNILKQYLNNALITEFVDDTACDTGNTADMTIGARGNLVRFFKGKIDDIRIYGRALTTQDINVLYNY
jgi:hypothetical protein